MAPSRSFRLFAALAACLLGFSSSGVAVAHAMVHAHWASGHETSAPFAVPTVEDGEHGHDHEHVAVANAATPRDGVRLDIALPAQVPATVQNVELVATDPVSSRLPSLLPRPGPERGPPSGPRAPPAA